MRTDRARLAAAAALALLLGVAPARAGRWSNHIDASMTHEIVLHDQQLYIATYGGVLVFDPATEQFTQYRNDSGLPSNALRCLAFDADGDIYVGTGDVGVAKVRIANGRLTLLRSLSEQIDGLASNRINSIVAWGDVIVYGSTPGAGTIRNDFASARYFQRDGLPGSDVTDVLPFGDEVWLSTVDDTLSRGGIATLNALGIIKKVAGAPTATYVLGTDGTNIWAGTNAGVRRYDPGTQTWTDLGLPTYRIRSFYWTGSEMWAGASKDFMRYSGTGTSWTTHSINSVQDPYQLQGGSVAIEVKGLAVLPGGDVYLGSANEPELRGANLVRWDGANLANLKADTPAANDTRRMDIDVDGSLWASWFSFYVGKLTPDGTWVNYNSAVPGVEIPSNAFTNIAFLADSQGEKWFSSQTRTDVPPDQYKKLDELDDKLDANYGNDVWVRHVVGSGGGDTYGTARPQKAAEDPVGNRWFLSDDEGASLGWSGIDILSRDKSQWFEMSPAKDGRMLSGNVRDVAFGSTSTLVAFKNAGVYRWSHGGFSWPAITNMAGDQWFIEVAVGGKDQLPSTAAITRILLRSDNLIWIATTTGLFYSYGSGGRVSTVSVYNGISPGIVSPNVQDILLDHDENLWVATDLGLNRISRESTSDIQTFLTPASYALLSGLRYSLDVISPLANADCRSLAIHPTRDILYVGTFGGISIYDFSAPAQTATNLSSVYVYPNPVYVSKGHTDLKIANITDPVRVEIYTLEGELVDSREVATSGDVAWDLTTREGLSASSGRYIVRIVGKSGSVQKPIALIR
ncbi:MAG TPA: two-component regulator propeller domain-containing protein [Candidatus Krumholzibacteria bacterium]